MRPATLRDISSRSTPGSARAWMALLTLLAVSGCGSPSEPSGAAVATFSVQGEMFRIRLVNDDQISAAEAARAHTGPTIPNGRIVSGTDVNRGWSWHLEDVSFADVTIEVCDGRPSDVEREGVSFGGGRFCPWSAEVVSIDR